MSPEGGETGDGHRTVRIPRVVLACLVTLQIAIPAAAALEFPALTGRVVDRADLISEEGELALDNMLAEHEAATTNQVVVVTLRSLQGASIEEYGVRLGQHWGIGQADRDNGVLLIVAQEERALRIEVGLGLERHLNDDVAKVIIEQEIVPFFKSQAYERGITAGTSAILGAIEGSYTPRRPSGNAGGSGASKTGKFAPIVVGAILLVVFGYLHIRTYVFPPPFSTPPRHSHYHYGYGTYHNHRNSSFGDSGSSGGFSGGGGSFGGGGASGSW